MHRFAVSILRIRFGRPSRHLVLCFADKRISTASAMLELRCAVNGKLFVRAHVAAVDIMPGMQEGAPRADRGIGDPPGSAGGLRRWLFVVILCAVGVLVVALIIGVVIGSEAEAVTSPRSTATPAPATAVKPALAASPPEESLAADANCHAWLTVRHDIDATTTSRLPAGWYWATSSRGYVTHFAARVTRELDSFELRLDNRGAAEVYRAAQVYVTAKRSELRALADGTYGNTVASTTAAARDRLNQLCDPHADITLAK